MKCVICKNGANKPGEVTVKLERGKSIILVKNVPAMVCNNCGHYYLDEKTTRYIYKEADLAIKKGAEIEVINLKAA